jgi:O-antigen ligase
MTSHPLWSDVVGDLTLVKYLGLACLIVALLHLLHRDSLPTLLEAGQGRMFLALALLAMLSYLAYGIAQPLAISPFMSWLSFVMLYVTTLSLVDSLPRLRWTLLFMVGSVAYGSLHAIREWQKYGHMSPGYRPGWITGDPNYFTTSALLCLPIAVALLSTRQSRCERSFCIFSIAVTLVAVTLAASRGGLLGLSAGALFMVWRSRHRLRNLALLLTILLPLMVISPSSPLHRLLHPNHHDDYAANERLRLALAGINMFTAHPWTGVGAGNFKALVRQYGDVNEDHIAHNTYISLLAELGIPGLALFAGVLGTTLWNLECIRRRTAEHHPSLIHQAAEASQASLLAYAVAVFFVSSDTHRLFWLVVFLSIVLDHLSTTHSFKRTSLELYSPAIPTSDLPVRDRMVPPNTRRLPPHTHVHYAPVTYRQ